MSLRLVVVCLNFKRHIAANETTLASEVLANVYLLREINRDLRADLTQDRVQLSQIGSRGAEDVLLYIRYPIIEKLLVRLFFWVLASEERDENQRSRVDSLTVLHKKLIEPIAYTISRHTIYILLIIGNHNKSLNDLLVIVIKHQTGRICRARIRFSTINNFNNLSYIFGVIFE